MSLALKMDGEEFHAGDFAVKRITNDVVFRRTVYRRRERINELERLTRFYYFDRYATDFGFAQGDFVGFGLERKEGRRLN
jgi:hypothetical protein